MGLNRRSFLGLTVGAAAGAAVGQRGGRVAADVAAALDRPYFPLGGPEDHVLSVCRLCPGGCGVRVRRIGGRPVKLEGNPLHPINAGRLCPRGQAALQLLYHPDRLAGPLRREGPRGSLSSFRPATWDEALEEISARLHLLRQQGRPEALALVRGEGYGLSSRVSSRFLKAFGSPNEFVACRGDEAAQRAVRLAQGVTGAPAFDLQSAEYVLSLGGSPLETSVSPVHTMRAYGEFRQGRSGRRGRLVHVGSRRSLTGLQADEWVAVRPSTEGILALGIAGVLVSEGLYDGDFVAQRTERFEDLLQVQGEEREGLRSFLKRRFPLATVAALTGVSVNRILELAREFAAGRPAIAIGPPGGGVVPSSLLDHLAAQQLNALVGSLDAPGGQLLADPTPLPAWPELSVDPTAEAGRSRPVLHESRSREPISTPSDLEALAEAILSGRPYRLEALLLDADPAFTSFAPETFAAALEHIPLVVSFASLPDDSALLSDWILPQPHFLEAWDLHTTPSGVAFPIASLSQPAVERQVHDVRAPAQVLLDLAARIGGDVSAALPWTDIQALVREQTRGLHAARRGAVFGTDFDEAWVRLMERAGWWAPGYRSEDELWTAALERGGWWDPFYDHWDWGRVLPVGGRYTFRVDELERLVEARPLSGGLTGADPRGRDRPERELALVLFEPLAIVGGTGGELPFLQEILDPELEARWETWVELHPETAAELSIADFDEVRVLSAGGSLRARARLTENVVPGVAGMPVGLGRRSGGRWARGVGANPQRLVARVREPESGLIQPSATRVRVLPAGATDPAAGEG